MKNAIKFREEELAQVIISNNITVSSLGRLFLIVDVATHRWYELVKNKQAIQRKIGD